MCVDKLLNVFALSIYRSQNIYAYKTNSDHFPKDVVMYIEMPRIIFWYGFLLSKLHLPYIMNLYVDAVCIDI